MIKNILRTLFLSFVCVAIVSASNITQFNETLKGARSLSIDQCLVAGPVPFPPPALIDENTEFPLKSLFDLDSLDPLRLWIREGDELEWSPSKILRWYSQNSEGGRLKLVAEGNIPQIAFLFCYLDSTRWQRVSLEIETQHLLKVYLDGVSVLTKDSSSKSKSETGDIIKGELALSQGKHRL